MVSKRFKKQIKKMIKEENFDIKELKKAESEIKAVLKDERKEKKELKHLEELGRMR